MLHQKYFYPGNLPDSAHGTEIDTSSFLPLELGFPAQAVKETEGFLQNDEITKDSDDVDKEINADEPLNKPNTVTELPHGVDRNEIPEDLIEELVDLDNVPVFTKPVTLNYAGITYLVEFPGLDPLSGDQLISRELDTPLAAMVRNSVSDSETGSQFLVTGFKKVDPPAVHSVRLEQFSREIQLL